MNTLAKKKILVIGSGWEQLALIETIKKAGHYVIATHPSINAEGFKLADQYYVKDSRDIQSHISIAQSHSIEAVISDNCDYSFYTASIIAAKLKLPFASIESALYSNDKFAQRTIVDSKFLKQPQYKKVQTIDQLIEAAKEIPYPTILKPIDSRGTFGVTKINNESELAAAFFDAINNSPSRTLIYEKFITGTLVTVDGFCFKNGSKSLAVASRKFEPGPKPVTKEIIYPAQFSDEINIKLLQNHNKVVEALNYKYGHTHGEYLLTSENEIYLVECTNRGGGVFTSSTIVPLLTGINLNEILLNQSLGIDNFVIEDLSIGFMKKSVILTFLDYQVGNVIDSINIEEMLSKPFTVKFRSKYKSNDMVESIENGAGRHSMLVIQGKNSAEALNNLSEFKRDLKITYHQ
jgi:biotin carboxylase